MKSFYGGVSIPSSRSSITGSLVHNVAEPNGPTDVYTGTRARVAVYDGPAAAPYVEDVTGDDARSFIEFLALRTYDLARDRGGSIPYSVVREITENLIHAGFAEPIVSVLDSGHTIRFSDQGPGIPDKSRALQPGFTTATSPMKDVIRGVGSGLPIVSDFLSVSGGRLSIEDNLDGGTVVTVYSSPRSSHQSVRPAFTVSEPTRSFTPAPDRPPAPLLDTPAAASHLFSENEGAAQTVASASLRLTNRQKQVLALVLESGTAGPSLVSRELGVGLSTAYRDLASLEDLGLISSESGKRTLTDEGLSFLGNISSSLL